MRVSSRWLADYIDLPTMDPDDLALAFASLGHEVEAIERVTADFHGVVTARVEEVILHPDAAKVRLCRVSTGGDPIDVWCGAWNFEAGAIVAYAAPGSILAGGFELGVRRMFGVDSHGMICSERELGLGDDHSGIIVLEPGTALGIPLESLLALPDVVFDLSITPNRPDCMSMVGLARELSAYYRVPYRIPETAVPESEDATAVRISIEDPTGCYRFAGRELRTVTVRPSPLWMRRRLRLAGVRAISNVVDVTNYVMLELGQPLHAFDLDKVAGERIVVRRAVAGERLTTLDGVDRALVADDLVVADTEKASALAGTMGGEISEVSAVTTRVLLEAAAWDPPTILQMSKRHGLRSEASARFERGVDPALGPVAAARAARLLVELGAGEALSGARDTVAVEVPEAVVELRLAEVRRVLGDGFDAPLVTELLTRLHLRVEGTDPLRVTAPTFRRDLTRPIDLVEEVARLHGLDQFGETVPFGTGGGWSREQERASVLRSALAGLGLFQAVPLSFMRLEDLDALGLPPGDERGLTIRVKNPLREEESVLRTTLLPGLLRAARYNLAYGAERVALFETGKVFLARPHPTLPGIPDQPDRLGIVLVGAMGGSAIDQAGRPADVFAITAVWRVLARRLDLGEVRLEAGVHPGLHPGRAARVWLGDAPVGWLGELHPAAAARFELTGRVAVAEVDLDALLAVPGRWQFVEPSPFPPATFDLAFIVPELLPAADLVETTAAAAGGLLERVVVFDEFRGQSLPAGTKSLALGYTLRAPDRTLTNEDVAPVRRRMAEAAARIGASLRGEA
jgi:phenylalanyl-tRNA synthetase beta chain